MILTKEEINTTIERLNLIKNQLKDDEGWNFTEGSLFDGKILLDKNLVPTFYIYPVFHIGNLEYEEAKIIYPFINGIFGHAWNYENPDHRKKCIFFKHEELKVNLKEFHFWRYIENNLDPNAVPQSKELEMDKFLHLCRRGIVNSEINIRNKNQ